MRTHHPNLPARAARGTVAALAALAFTTVGADRAAAAPAAPITDVTSYPAPLPDGCPDGAGALLGVQFDNGRGGVASDLRFLDVRHGDTVTMRWAAFAPGCADGAGNPLIAVSLVGYDNPTPHFDPTVDQALLPGWDACGYGLEPCARDADGKHMLSMSLPPEQTACNLQLEGVLGLPLAVVGPSGSFYSTAVRGGGPNMLISAANFGVEPCEEAPTTPDTTPQPSIPDATVPAVPEGQPEAPEVLPSDASDEAPLPRALPAEVRDVAAAQLPITGPAQSPAGLAAGAAVLTLLGGAALAGAGLWRRKADLPA